MRPINLRIKGINSYVAEQEINFSKLAENNIFGIFGETGSGKTTILDSIILALYGVSDRDSLQNLINVNTKDAFVEFVFEMENASNDKVNTYFVRRDFKLRASGLKAEAVLNDVDKNTTIAEMPENVNNKILELIGIGKKEFTKCIALPQGEFDRFLSDTPALRKKTLAKLFDLEQFGIILNDKLKKRKEIVKINHSTLLEKISLYQGISKETISKTEEVLAKSDIEIKSLQRLIARDKKLVEKIKSELEVKQQLLEMEVLLSIKHSELSEINFLQKQIDYTEKYGDFTILNTKHDNCLSEMENLHNNILENQAKLEEVSSRISKLEILAEDNQEKTVDTERQLNNALLMQEKKTLHELQLKQLTEDKENIGQKLLDASAKIVELNLTVQNNKSTIIDLESSYKKLEKAIFDNCDLIEKLSDGQNIKTKQDFALFLTITKNKIDPDSLLEVENYNIHDEVTSVVHDIEDYELGVRKEIAKLMQELRDLKFDMDTINEAKQELVEQNEVYNSSCDDIEEQLAKTKELLATNKATIENLTSQCDEYNESLTKIKRQILEEQNTIKNIATTDSVYLRNILDNYKQEKINIKKELDECIAARQKLVIDIEVNSNNVENYKEKLTQLTTALKPYSKSTFKQKADPTLLINYENLEETKTKIDTYNKELGVLETNTERLREKTKEYTYTKDDYNSLVESIDNNETKLTELRVFINVNKITIDIQKQNLTTVLELQKELEIIEKQVNAIEQLEGLLSGGALIDFVSEEYMGLITDFANSYVYKISKGKYLLKYDGDFNVIDNFNGGIKRSVKTLSGGERFIVSLSLALGISQSIAVNNNKNFNFFFIDEGFGNLSENYIEKVLQSLNALIKLNLTVGFITHVEKMQFYLNNRIIVKKDNTDEGSKIYQYF